MPHHIPVQMSFSSPTSIPGYLNSLCIPLGLPVSASTFYKFPFYAWVRSSLFSMQASCHLCLISYLSGWTVLELGEGHLWKSASFCGLLSRAVSRGTLPSISENRQKLLSWSPGLWSCFFILLLSLRIRNSTISWWLQLRLPWPILPWL